MSREIFLIDPTRLSEFPNDASLVLEIRERVLSMVPSKKSLWQTPVDDLVAEANDPYAQELGHMVVHPIAFLFPNIILEILSIFDASRAEW